MFAKRLSLALLTAVAFGSAAFANDDVPSDAVIVHTVRCEAGRVGQQLMVLRGFPANLKMTVSWTSTKIQKSAFGVVLQFFHVGGSGELSRQEIDQLMSTGLSFNLYPANLEVCRGYRKDIIQEGIGVYDCLINHKLESLRAAVEGGSGSAGCRREVTISKKLNGELKLDVWGVDLGPSASWGDSYAFTFDIAAPRAKSSQASSR